MQEQIVHSWWISQGPTRARPVWATQIPWLILCCLNMLVSPYTETKGIPASGTKELLAAVKSKPKITCLGNRIISYLNPFLRGLTRHISQKQLGYEFDRFLLCHMSLTVSQVSTCNTIISFSSGKHGNKKEVETRHAAKY